MYNHHRTYSFLIYIPSSLYHLLQVLIGRFWDGEIVENNSEHNVEQSDPKIGPLNVDQ